MLERRSTFTKVRTDRDPGLIIGDDVVIHTYSDFAIHPNGYVEIGAGSVLVGAVLMCWEQITIGKRAVISYDVTIADSDFHPIDAEQRRRDCEALAPEGDGKRPPFASRAVVIGRSEERRVGK